MKFEVRKYNESDKEHIKRFFNNLARDIAIYNPLRKKILSPGYSDYYLKKTHQAVEKGKGIIVVAECEKKLIGYSIGIIKDYTAGERLEFNTMKRGYLADVYVERMYRNQGVGTKLIGEIERYFKMKGCTYYEINVVLANKHAYSLYKKLGFIDHNVNMIKSI